jgi:hypothetical protein
MPWLLPQLTIDDRQLSVVNCCVRKAGLEPACLFGRHPLKMVRLPISPLPHVVSVDGFEPSTLCLKGRCSTPELHAPCRSRGNRGCNHPTHADANKVQNAQQNGNTRHSKSGTGGGRSETGMMVIFPAAAPPGFIARHPGCTIFALYPFPGSDIAFGTINRPVVVAQLLKGSTVRRENGSRLLRNGGERDQDGPNEPACLRIAFTDHPLRKPSERTKCREERQATRLSPECYPAFAEPAGVSTVSVAFAADRR